MLEAKREKGYFQVKAAFCSINNNSNNNNNNNNHIIIVINDTVTKLI